MASLRSELDKLNRQLEQTCTLRLQPHDTSDSQVTHLCLLCCMDHYFESVMPASQWLTYCIAWPRRSAAALVTQPCPASQVSCTLQVRSGTLQAQLQSYSQKGVLLSQRWHVRAGGAGAGAGGAARGAAERAHPGPGVAPAPAGAGEPRARLPRARRPGRHQPSGEPLLSPLRHTYSKHPPSIPTHPCSAAGRVCAPCLRAVPSVSDYSS